MILGIPLLDESQSCERVRGHWIQGQRLPMARYADGLVWAIA